MNVDGFGTDADRADISSDRRIPIDVSAFALVEKENARATTHQSIRNNPHPPAQYFLHLNITLRPPTYKGPHEQEKPRNLRSGLGHPCRQTALRAAAILEPSIKFARRESFSQMPLSNEKS